jgi:hypothetical protein
MANTRLGLVAELYRTWLASPAAGDIFQDQSKGSVLTAEPVAVAP